MSLVFHEYDVGVSYFLYRLGRCLGQSFALWRSFRQLSKENIIFQSKARFHRTRVLVAETGNGQDADYIQAPGSHYTIFDPNAIQSKPRLGNSPPLLCPFGWTWASGRWNPVEMQQAHLEQITNILENVTISIFFQSRLLYLPAVFTATGPSRTPLRLQEPITVVASLSSADA